MSRVLLSLVAGVAFAWLFLSALSPELAGVGRGAAQQEGERRPVVMVHGFGSDAGAWESYLGPDGFLITGVRGGGRTGGRSAGYGESSGARTGDEYDP
jgi:hypothetical protein